MKGKRGKASENKKRGPLQKKKNKNTEERKRTGEKWPSYRAASSYRQAGTFFKQACGKDVNPGQGACV